MRTTEQVLLKEDADNAVARLPKKVKPAVPFRGSTSLARRREELALIAALSAEKAFDK